MSFEANVSAVVVGGSLLLLLLTWSRKSGQKTSHRFPPSPPTNSIMGHRLPDDTPFLLYESWFKQYGPLISLRSGLDRYVVIGGHKAAMDIMEKQGSALADRPRLVAAGELLSGGDLRASIMRAGERFKRMRKAFHTHLQPKAAKAYQPTQVLHAKRVLMGLLESPAQFQNHAWMYASSVIIKIAYGKNVPTHPSHPDMIAIHKSFWRLLGALNTGAYLVDTLPWLKYLPWYGQDLRRGFVEDRELFQRMLNGVKSQMNDPDSGPSFGKSLLEGQMDSGMDKNEIAFLAGSMFSAGSHTTSFANCIAMMTAALHPDAQAAVQAELDAVVGTGRLPTFDDEEHLPLLHAFILETMRWRPQAPLGIAHRATEDIIWGDYCIPAGTLVFGSHWAISRDPEVFPDPDKFDMTRWLTSDGKLREDLKFPHYGFGRRVCPGQHLANKSIYINMVFALWAFRISVDASKPVYDLGYIDNPLRHPNPIGLHFEPRVPTETLKVMIEE